ncbi:CHAT domain-containing tetratricopeptide repeat protein [Rhizobium ruizarguesonis]|uniref:CHAT domain-containing tetratricopeptide repeat protein n=1 Tax=Rhizobium ruizarguesonis TaxID=2081791 RepID=UPI0013D451C9|nr:CHAT domain-containing protein [Rhizobium ruizarguesonis]NEH76854.1 tetratricopeptide repeat protein [Rhizobium ruizarguesonis]
MRAATLFAAILLLLSTTNTLASDANISAMNDRTLQLYNAGDVNGATTNAEEAVQAARLIGQVDAAFATALGNEAELARQSANLDKARKLFEEALKMFRDIRDTQNPNYMNQLLNYGLVLQSQGEFEQAEAQFRLVLKGRELSEPSNTIDIASIKNLLGDLEASRSNCDAAIRWYGDAIEGAPSGTNVSFYSHQQLARCAWNVGDLAKARAEYELAVQQVRSLKPQPTHPLATVLIELADVLHTLTDYSAADARSNEAIEILSSDPNRGRELLVQAIQTKASNLRDWGRLNQADTEYARAAATLGPATDQNAYQRAGLENATGMLRSRQGRYGEAEAHIRNALTLYAQLNTSGRETAAAATNLGVLLQDSGRPQQAIPYLEQALNIFDSNGLQRDPYYGNLLGNLGLAYMGVRRFDDAERLFSQEISQDSRKYGDESVVVGSSLVNRADLYNAMGSWNDALRDAQGAVNIFEQNPSAPIRSKANAYHRLGLAELLLGRSDAAIVDLKKARQLLESENLTSSSLGGVMNSLGLAFNQTGDHEKAIEAMELAKSVNMKAFGSDSAAVAADLSGIGWTKAAVGDLVSAAQAFRSANDISVRRLKENWTAAGDDFAAAKLRPLDIGSSFEGEIQTLSRLPATTTEEQQALAARTFEVAQWSELTDTALSIRLAGARLAAADPSLQSAIRNRQDASVIRSKLEHDLVALFSSEKSWDTEAIEKIRGTRAQLSALENRIRELDIQLKSDRATAKYMEIASPEALSVKDVQGLLSSDEALIYIFVTSAHQGLPEESFVWVVTKEEVHLKASPAGAGAIAQFIKTLRCGLDPTLWYTEEGNRRCSRLTGAFPDEGAPLPYRLDLAYALYYQLFESFTAFMKDKRLIVATNSSLTTLPLEALPIERPSVDTVTDYSQLEGVKWLIREHTVSMLPSISSLKVLRDATASRTPPLAFAGFGDPSLNGIAGHCKSAVSDFSCQDFQPKGSEVKVNSRGGSITQLFRTGVEDNERARMVLDLCPLPETATELKCTAATIGLQSSALFLGKEFTRDRLFALSESGELAKYRVLHFATHGLLPDTSDSPLEAALVCTPTASDDGLIVTSDIAKLKLNADWVVLSACNTGSGAGGSRGLADAFFYAGARAVLISNWEVDSRVAAALGAGLFMTNQKRDQSLAVAHQRSLLAVLDGKGSPEYKHPSYWAPFTVIGGSN